MNTPSTTHMRREVLDIPDVTRRLLREGNGAFKEVAARLRATEPGVVVTVARGSSDHAATYFKYACELTMGVPVASIGPSIASIYGASLNLRNAACIGISQSGQSPDIVRMMKSARDHGALSIAITNEPSSPLASVSDTAIPICAGVEKSVAATKTFVASIVAELALLAHWARDHALIAAVEALPDHFEQAVQFDWPHLQDALQSKATLFTLGRGTSLSIAHEAALKFKETCQIHAEAYSSAEVLHGPVSVVEPGFPILALVARDATQPSVAETCDRLVANGATVFATSDMVSPERRLDFVATGHSLTDPLALVVSFYSFIERLAQARGIDPDTPRNLKKVTETV